MRSRIIICLTTLTAGLVLVLAISLNSSNAVEAESTNKSQTFMSPEISSILTPALSINDKSQLEFSFNGTADVNFTVTLSAASTLPVTVNYATSDGTATSSDYQAASGTLSFNPGETSKRLIVRVIADSMYEANETYFVNLTNPTGATISKGQGVGTIINDDAPPALSIYDVRVREGNSGNTNATFSITLSAATGLPLSVNYATSAGSATAGSDFQSASGTLNFNGETTRTITVLVNGDTVDEPDETFFVTLSNPTNATIADGQGVGTILDDDGPPTVAIDDVFVTEGNSGAVNASFTVSLSWTSTQPVTVQYTTANGTAIAGTDYQSASGTLMFDPGEMSKPISVLVTGDALDEPNETFFVNLSAATSATIADDQGIGTIDIFNEFGNLSVDGRRLGKMKLYDDGTHGDSIPGDYTYSRSGIGYTGPTGFRGGLLGAGIAHQAKLTTPSAEIVQIPGNYLNAVNSIFSVDLYSIDEDAQFTRDAANVRVDPNRSDWDREATNRFYQKFSDGYDFVFLFPNKPFGSDASPIRNDVLGIGQGMFDTSQTYGSSGRLQLVVGSAPTTTHLYCMKRCIAGRRS